MSTTDTADWIARIVEARGEADRAAARFEQVIRDAAAAGGVSESAIAKKALGTDSRKRVRAILSREPEDTGPPSHTPVAVIHGARRELAAEISRALAARGWIRLTEDDARHLARGGVPVVACRLRDGAAVLCQQRAVWRDGLVLEDDGVPRTVAVEETVDSVDRMGQPGLIRRTSPEAVARAIAATL